MAEVAFLAERGEVGFDVGKEFVAVGFEVDEEDEGLGGILVEDAGVLGAAVGVGRIPAYGCVSNSVKSE